MLKPRIKAIFVLLLATIVIMAVTVKNTPPVSEYMQTGIRLSDLPDKECVAFMASKGAHMPGHYKQSLYFRLQPRTISPLSSKTRIKHCVAYTATHPQINTSKMSAKS